MSSSKDGRSSPKAKEMGSQKHKRKTVAENLIENVRKWEALNSVTGKRSTDTPEVLEVGRRCGTSRSGRSDIDSDVEIIEVVPRNTNKTASSQSTLYSRRCPLSRRQWQDTKFGKDIRKHGMFKKSFGFSVMSYNVLAQDLLVQHPHLYQQHQSAALEWPRRHSKLLREVTFHLPDILCLQEVQASHWHEYFLQPLSRIGYEGIFKQRTGNKVDGCAIFWQRGKMNMLEQVSVEYYQPGVSVLNRDNVALLARLGVLGSSDELVVASTHLLYNPRRDDVRLAQTQLLLAELDRVSHGASMPVILAGDFNLQPHASVYELLIRGQLEFNNTVPSYLGITDCCRHSSLLMHRQVTQSRNIDIVSTELQMLNIFHSERRMTEQDRQEQSMAGKFNTGELSHGLNLKSAYEHHRGVPERQEMASTYQDKWVTVDYIFYGDVKETYGTRRKLRLLGRWSLPTVAECEQLGPIPNLEAPSDHLPLVACFLLN